MNPSSSRPIILRNFIPGGGFRPPEGSCVDRMCVYSCQRLGEISLFEKFNAAIPAQPASHRARKPLAERALRFRVTHGSEFFRSASLDRLIDETHIGERQHIHVDVISQVVLEYGSRRPGPRKGTCDAGHTILAGRNEVREKAEELGIALRV
jgi:hypothetical protein